MQAIGLGSSPNDWLLDNVQQMGYYRVNYDMENWKALIHQLKTDHTVSVRSYVCACVRVLRSLCICTGRVAERIKCSPRRLKVGNRCPGCAEANALLLNVSSLYAQH